MSACYLIMAGGTGGHIFPALATAQTLQKKGDKVLWLGSAGGMETRIVPRYDIFLHMIAIKGVRGNGLKRKLTLPFILFKTIKEVMQLIKQNNIKGAIGFGGFVSFPGAIAAKLCGIPLIIHEQNAVAGLSNKILSHIANRVFFAFPKTFKDATGCIGNPLRQQLLDQFFTSVEYRFKQRSGPLRLFILGGSLGAKIFNDTLPEIIACLPLEQRPLIHHQCGKDNENEVKKRYAEKQIKAKVFSFITDMTAEYNWADFVICRAGALTIAELTVVGLGGYLIPFPYAVDDHQHYNALHMVKAGAALCITQTDFSVKKIANDITFLTREQCLNWAKSARSLAKLNAAEVLADTIKKLNKRVGE